MKFLMLGSMFPLPSKASLFTTKESINLFSLRFRPSSSLLCAILRIIWVNVAPSRSDISPPCQRKSSSNFVKSSSNVSFPSFSFSRIRIGSIIFATSPSISKSSINEYTRSPGNLLAVPSSFTTLTAPAAGRSEVASIQSSSPMSLRTREGIA